MIVTRCIEYSPEQLRVEGLICRSTISIVPVSFVSGTRVSFREDTFNISSWHWVSIHSHYLRILHLRTRRAKNLEVLAGVPADLFLPILIAI